MPHRNAPLTETGRLRLARCVVEDGWPVRRDGLLVHRSEWASADQLAAVIANLARADQRLAAGEQPRMSLSETLWSMERLTKKP